MPSTTRIAPQIYWLVRRHLPEILAIETDVFPQPWTEEEFRSHLKQCNCIGMVAELDETIVGYMAYYLEQGVLRLLNFAVAREHQRQGIGSAMMGKLKAKLLPGRRTKIVGEVRESNLTMQLFLRSQGFIADGVERNPWGTGEDSYRFEWELG